MITVLVEVSIGSTVRARWPQVIGPGVVFSRPASCPFSASGQSRPRPCLAGPRGYHNHNAANVPQLRPTVIGHAFEPWNWSRVGMRGD